MYGLFLLHLFVGYAVENERGATSRLKTHEREKGVKKVENQFCM